MAKSEKPHSEGKATTANLPTWDILPPFQFINPRTRTVERKEETKPNDAIQPPRSVLTPSVAPTSTVVAPSSPQVTEKCPACGSPVQPEAEFCGECGLRLSNSAIEAPPHALRCPHCGAEVEHEKSEDTTKEHTCPECGKNFIVG